jgi:hypothetical protein
MTTPTGILFSDPQAKPLSTVGQPQSGCYYCFFMSGTTTLSNVYADGLLGTPLSQPTAGSVNPVAGTVADSAGRFVPIYLNPTVIYRAQLYSAAGVKLEDSDPIVVPGVGTAASIGPLLFPITAAETAAGFTQAALQPYPWGNVLRYGIVPNSTGAAATNTTLFAALVNASIANGPTGPVYFPNSGAGAASDVYYFGTATPFQVRSGVHIDLQGCTLSFSGLFNTAMNAMGFFNLCFDASLENGSVKVNYNGTGGTNNGMTIRVGSRSGYPFGTYTTGIFDQDNLAANSLPLQGGIVLRNLRLQSNNPAANCSGVLVYFGGLFNCITENIWIDGQSAVVGNGIYGEYGWSSTNSNPGTMSLWTSSHMTNSVFRNINVTNLAMGATSTGFGFNGQYGNIIENIYVNGADQGVNLGIGEAMYYNVWALNQQSPNRQSSLRNINVFNLRTVGVTLSGAGAVGGYLAATINALTPAPVKYQAQTDLQGYSMDGFSIVVPTATGTAIEATGTFITLRSGVTNGGTVQIGAEAMKVIIEDVDVLNSGGPNGIRFGQPAAVWSPARMPDFVIRTSKVAGSTGVGIAVAACQSGLIENCQLGFNTTNDTAAEATQTNGVNLAATSYGVKCRGCSTTTASAAAAYNSANDNANNMNSIENERITQTTSGGGLFSTDFQSASAQIIATNGTITTGGLKVVRLAPAGPVTGVKMQAGQRDGEVCWLCNESASADSITFAASGTSLMSLGTALVIAGLAKYPAVWDSAAGLWT